MKRLLLFFIVATAFFTACEKEATIRTSFPFTVTADYKEKAIINVPNELSFDLTPEHIVTTNVYTISYRILNGEGVFSLPNEEEVQEGQTIELDGLKLKSLFTPESLGDIKVEFTLADQQGESRIFIVEYVSENNPFEVDLNSARSNITVNETANFTLTLTNKGTDPDVTYTIKSFISQGTGEIKLVKANNKEDIILGDSYDIEEGTTTYEVIFTEEGVNTITVEVEDVNGQKLIKKFDFTVDVIDFVLSATPERNETNLGNDININFLISEVSGGNDDYTLRYVIESGNANILNGATQVFAGTNIKVPLAQEFSWFFKPLEKGEVVIRFIAKNNSGVEKEKSVTITVNDRSFDFTATRSLASFPVGEPVNISYKITEQGGSSVDSYTMVFESSSNGKLTINSVDYIAGDLITVPSLDFVGVYTPSIPGTHLITSTITAASNSVTKEKDVSVSVEASDFDFTITSNTEVIVNESIDLSFNINELVGDSKFKISYNVNGPNNEFKNNNGAFLTSATDYDVDNTFGWKLKGVKPGRMDVTFTITNQYDVSKSKTITIEVKNIDFDFTVSPIGSDFQLDNNILFDVTMDAPSSLTYQMKFTSNTGGNINYNSGFFNVDTFFDISNTNFNVSYTSENSGNVVMNITILASNGVTKTKSINFQISQKPKIISGILEGSFFGSSSSCSRLQNARYVALTWTKSPGEGIVSATILVNGNSIIKSFVPSITENSNEAQKINVGCYSNAVRSLDIEATITDSKGLTSTVYKGRVSIQ